MQQNICFILDRMHVPSDCVVAPGENWTWPPNEFSSWNIEKYVNNMQNLIQIFHNISESEMTNFCRNLRSRNIFDHNLRSKWENFFHNLRSRVLNYFRKIWAAPPVQLGDLRSTIFILKNLSRTSGTNGGIKLPITIMEAWISLVHTTHKYQLRV